VDLGELAANYGTIGGAEWSNGDFNNDHNVDVSDLGILVAAYGTGSSSVASQSVPEPSMISMILVLCGLGLWRHRRQ
ncbi:MAG: PEP-CTERM sorting domain-containing protein, partial [Pirellulales bacterium]|nr:PEP-CTERM sorting domain-containing protein [Pirellulales bacterium]